MILIIIPQFTIHHFHPNTIIIHQHIRNHRQHSRSQTIEQREAAEFIRINIDKYA
jgi:hypothetical protein